MPMKYKQENVVGGLFPSEKCQELVDNLSRKRKEFPTKRKCFLSGKSSVKACIMVPSEEDLGKLSSPHLD